MPELDKFTDGGAPKKDSARPPGRRLRIRVDEYDPRKGKQGYRPSMGQAIIFVVADAREQHAMFQSLVRWGKKRDWAATDEDDV